MKITILCVGKIKERFMRDAISEYQKRLTRYVKLDIVEVPDEKTPDHASEKEEVQIRQREGEKIFRHIKNDDYVIALAIDGKQCDSVSFAEKIEQYGITGKSNVVYVIGGSLGLSETVLNRADEKISFSKMTFPHQLMRVILMEQIYRAYRIIKKEPYHK
nr:23S rRNA (pseudouridine(1915)-N(3))-methyltransferase RlmH [Eubacterium sp.]